MNVGEGGGDRWAACRVSGTTTTIAAAVRQQQKWRILSGMRHAERDRESSVANNSRPMSVSPAEIFSLLLLLLPTAAIIEENAVERRRLKGKRYAVVGGPSRNSIAQSCRSLSPFFLHLHLTNSEHTGTRNKSVVECRPTDFSSTERREKSIISKPKLLCWED